MASSHATRHADNNLVHLLSLFADRAARLNLISSVDSVGLEWPAFPMASFLPATEIKSPLMIFERVAMSLESTAGAGATPSTWQRVRPSQPPVSLRPSAAALEGLGQVLERYGALMGLDLEAAREEAPVSVHGLAQGGGPPTPTSVPGRRSTRSAWRRQGRCGTHPRTSSPSSRPRPQQRPTCWRRWAARAAATAGRSSWCRRQCYHRLQGRVPSALAR